MFANTTLRRRAVKATAIALTAATLGTVAMTTMAEARPYGYGYGYHRRGIGPGGAAALGVVGGLAAGALIAGAARPAYGAPTTYDLGPAYPAYDEGPICHWERRSVWVAPETYQIRRVQVCD